MKEREVWKRGKIRYLHTLCRKALLVGLNMWFSQDSNEKVLVKCWRARLAELEGEIDPPITKIGRQCGSLLKDPSKNSVVGNGRRWQWIELYV